jgi:tetratricopeptide (TPR) repeat protein
MRALARDGSGDRTGALADFKKAVELDPLQPDAWLSLGVRLQDKKASEDAFATAIDLYPLFEKAWFARGRVRYDRSDLRGARSDLARYLELAPEGEQASEAKTILEEIQKKLAGD